MRADFSFVQITDTHIVAGATDQGHNGAVSACLKEIAALQPAPAFLAHTGDVTETGSPAEFAAYRAMIGALPRTLPTYVAPGNHDVRWIAPSRDGFRLATGNRPYQSWDYQNVHFVLLDSTVPLEHWGHFDAAELAWLAQDLRRNGTARPVVIGFHHWIGRESLMVDNEDALLAVIAPYNVRLFLIGHGHADIQWNVNGIPAIMAKGLYQGSYNLVRVTRDRLQVLRRTTTDTAPVKPILTVSLGRPAAPEFRATVNAQGGELRVAMARGKIPKAATVACRLDQARPVPIDPGDTEWSGLLPLGGIVPGVHRVLFLTTMPDGRVYQTPVTLTLSAPNASTPLWTVNVAASVQGAVATDGFTVYVPTMGGDLVALDGRNGRQLWRFSTGAGLFSAPLIDGDNLIFGSEDGSVYSVDRSKGALRYKVAAGAPVLSGIARAGNVVCVPVTDGRILGLDPATGKTLWTAPGDGLYQSRPATDGKRFFVGGWDNFVRCLDAATGKEIWKTRLGRLFYFAPAIGDPSLNSEHSLLYISSNDGALHALDAQTGATRWSVPGPSLGYSGPLFLDGSVYNASLTDTGRVFAFDAVTGAPRWEATTGSVIYDSSCCAAGDDICVGSVDGTFSRIRPGDGEIVYQYHLAPGHLLASPAADAGRVYIGTLSGDVTAFAATH